LSAQKLSAGRANAKTLVRLIAHETCHVYGRFHPNTRRRLLGRLGFRVVGPIGLGDSLEPRRLTNPDSPQVDSVIRVTTADKIEFDAALVLYADPPRFSAVVGRGVFGYLKYGLLPVADNGQGGYQSPHRGPGLPTLYSPESVQGFFEQAGRNTRYILSPDEILAENVALAFLGPEAAIADPRLPADLLAIIRESTERAIER
jgi:hypothetical protein